jgi:hypothetical protein
MAFIDRFVRVPILVYDITEEDLPRKQYEESFAYILPLEIDAFYPSFNRNRGTAATHIYMKSGRSCVTEIEINDFIELVNRHLQQ